LALFVQGVEDQTGDPEEPLRTALRALDPDTLSPREALELLYQLRRDFL
jgi:DNA mismatch repair protein MutS